MKRRSNKQKTPYTLRRKGFRLCYVGWAMFLLSMFLPAVKVLDSVMPGWTCAWAVLWILGMISKPSHLLIGIYWASFSAANLLMLVSPLLMRRVTDGKGRDWLPSALLIAAFVDVLSLLHSFDNRSDYFVGYYVWMASFGVTAMGSLYVMQARRMKQRATSVSPAPKPRTPEEMAAERELQTYLHTA